MTSKKSVDLPRCAWVSTDPHDRLYHDNEWGVPIFNDRHLFEFLILEGMQAGLSWLTILKKRDRFRLVFDNFNPKKIATYNDKKIQSLLSDPGIIRNRLKINAAIENAKAFLAIQKEMGSFSDFIWETVNHAPIQNNYTHFNAIPTKTSLSDNLTKKLKAHGFKFVGSTICYAFMQAVGMVNDHTTDCFRWKIVKKM